MTCDCSVDLDPHRLVREGTRQDGRGTAIELRPDEERDPARLLVDPRRPEHAMVFASTYARHLRYFGLDDQVDRDWHSFFSSDVSARLAVVAVEDVAVYRTRVTELLRHLKNPATGTAPAAMAAELGAVFDHIGTLALRLDTLKEDLPADQPLRTTLANLIRSHLGPMLRRLIGYHQAGQALGLVDPAGAPDPGALILRQPIRSFTSVVADGLRADEWWAASGRIGWANYVTFDPAERAGHAEAYVSGDPVRQMNHLATHSLFTAAHEAFLAVYARVVDGARSAVRTSFDAGDHAPHYALFLAFLRLLDQTRTEANGLTARHLDFYYRQVLQLTERPAERSQAHVLVELAKPVKPSHLIPAGARLKAGKDDTGADAYFAVDRDLVANQAAVADIRHVARDADGTLHAEPVADNARSWPPFRPVTKTTVGFAIASHHLWLAEGTRTIVVKIDGLSARGLRCRLTTAKGWLDKEPTTLRLPDGKGGPANLLTLIGIGGGPGVTAPIPSGLVVRIEGGDPPIVPFDPAVHDGYGDLGTNLPVLVVEPVDGTAPFDLDAVPRITVTVVVDGLRTLTLSNDHGPIDGSRPFQPYGPTPIEGSQFIIGANEAFQKHLTSLTITPAWMGTAKPFPTPTDAGPQVEARHLSNGRWELFPVAPNDTSFSATAYRFSLDPTKPPLKTGVDLAPAVPYGTASRDGFIRFRLTRGFGFDTYPVHLAGQIASEAKTLDPPPVAPQTASISIRYTAEETINLASPAPDSDTNHARFLHLTPFAGHLEPARNGKVTLFPQLRSHNARSAGELYLGIRNLEPGQNLALLFQVVDGTADPLAAKPPDHIEWSFLQGNEWVRFGPEAVADLTDGLLTSGIVTLAVPPEADTGHTVLPSGLRWIRLAVAQEVGAVCDLARIAAQALKASCVVGAAGSTAHTRELPAGTITKFDPPDAAVKGVSQPFPTFGGRPAETALSFTTRVSERLRHKDRAITLSDFEHLILERFPGIFQVRCLNHTRYEPGPSGGIYRERTPGHVTVVTIPDLPNPHDELRPYTNLGVLKEIEAFLAPRMSCFVRLHASSPQFEEVRVDLRVRLRPGRDKAYHTTLLRQDITGFLSPWAFGRKGRPTFNGTIHRSVLVDFLDGLEYVDYVTDVALLQRISPEAAWTGVDETVVGSRAVSVLVSAPPDDHGVTIIDPTSDPAPEHCACEPAGHS